MDLLISVIMATYNRAEYIEEAIDSIKRQTFKDYEIIVVDDGSTDNTKEILEKFKDVRYIPLAHGGIATARNAAVKAARGKWIAFLDSDDMWIRNSAILPKFQRKKWTNGRRSCCERTTYTGIYPALW